MMVCAPCHRPATRIGLGLGPSRRILAHQIRTDLMAETGIRHSVTPATQFSGDMILAARSPRGKLYATLADATGHGLAAAVSVLPMVQEFYRLVELDHPLISMVESINFMLVNSLHGSL